MGIFWGHVVKNLKDTHFIDWRNWMGKESMFHFIVFGGFIMRMPGGAKRSTGANGPLWRQ